MELIFGMPVFGRDGAECGTLDRVLVDPTRSEITHLVVRSPRVSEDVLLPLSLVQGCAELRLLLHAAGGDLENMPRYYEGRRTSTPAGRVDTAVVREPPERRQDLEAALRVPPDAREYGPETPVVAGDAKGHLVGMAANQFTYQIAELRASGMLVQEIVVPERWIGELRDGVISLSATSEQLGQLVAVPSAAYVSRQSGEAREITERSPRR